MLNYQLPRNNRPVPKAFPLAGKLVLCFAVLCAILTAIGGIFFFGLRSIENLNRAERASTLGEIAILHRVGKNLAWRQVEVFRHIDATSSEDKQRHEQVIARLVETNTQSLTEYGKIVRDEAKRRLYEKVIQARKAYSDQTERLFALSRAHRSAETTTLAVTTQIPAYDQYQMALDALLRFEEAEGSGIAAATTARIEQTRIIGDLLIGLAILIALGTGATVLKMVRTLRRDKQRLQNEVEEHQQAEQALREGEARYRLLVDHSPDAIFVVCEDKIVFANPTTLKLLGAAGPQQVIGRSPFGFVHPDERAEVAFRSREVAEGKEPPATKRRFLRVDGSAVEVESRVIFFLYEGKPALQVIAQDKTERKTAAEKLDAQENQYRLLFEDNPTPMWVYDAQSFSILAVNQAAIAGYGYSRGEFLSRTLHDLYLPEDAISIESAKGDAIAPARHGGECRHVKKDGTVITAAVYSSPTIFDRKQARMGLAVDLTERVEAENRVRESEENLALAQQVAGVGSWEYPFDADGQINEENLIWSQEAYRLFGLSSELPISTKTFFEAVHPDDRTRVAERFITFKEGVGSYKADFRIIRPDGMERIVHCVAERVFDTRSGKPLKVVGTVLDITELRGVEKQLREAEEKYRSIFDNSQEGIFQNTPDGILLSANPALARMFGFASPEEMVRDHNSREPQSYSHPVERHEFKRLIEEKGVVNNFEYEVQRQDGSKIWVSENVLVVRDATGKALHYEGSVRDITERKHSEQELLRSEERFRSFTKATWEIVWQTDPAGQVVEDLPSWRAYTGQSTEEILGAGWIDCVHPDDRAPTLRHWAECREKKSVYEIEYRMRGADGIYRLFSARGVPVFDAGGAVREWIGANTDITERKQAEEVLAESERRFRLMNDLSDTTRSLTQPKEIMVAAARLLGTHLRVSRCAYAEMETDGDRFHVHGDYTDGCDSVVGDIRLSDFGESTHSKMAAGRTLVLHDVDAELKPDEGAEALGAIEIKAMISCPLIKNGDLVAMMAVHHRVPRQWTNAEVALVQEVVERCWSIIERARAELVLRESEEHLRLVIAASNDGIWEHDYVKDVLTWSDRMYEMFGLDRRSFAPSVDAFTALLHPDDRLPFQNAVREQMASGGRYEAHTRILRGDGSFGNFLGRGRVVLNAVGAPIRIVGSLADLTGLLRAEQKLVEQANLLNLAHDAIMVRDMDDRVEFWNHGAETLYGWASGETRGRLVGDFLYDEEPVAVSAARRTLLETGAWSGECRHLTKQGGTVIVRSRWTLVRDERGQPKSKLVINTDITEQKKIEEQFLRAQRLESIGTLASGVAHDLNNILVPIMMAAPVLRGEIEPDQRERFLDIVETSAQRGADIIKQVLTFARGADGDRILLQPIFLLEEVSKIAGQTFPKSIALRTSYEENIRLLEADSTQLHQLLLNLCINARDAMPNGGELCLGVENFDVDQLFASANPGATTGPHVLFQITDSGSGIPKDVLDKIFDPFFTTKSIGHGTGLGLSTVAGIVKSHGGFINVASEPGRTTFKIFLPAKETVDTSTPLPTNTSVPRGLGETILVVDDEPSIREVAQIILEGHGYKVLIAEDGPSALAIFARQMGRISVVVTDLAMPGMNGLMLIRTLRQIEPELKVIVSTGRADDAHIAEITALAVDGCLTKPYTTRNLLLKLSHLLHSSLQDAA